MSAFFSIENPAEGLYKEKGSKFLAFAFPLVGKEDIDACLSQVRKKYHDARHHCYAWVLGTDSQEYRANDDGEPNHSAGDPILGQIRSFGLTNTLVVVVRYFGGIKLGVGGLKQAYKEATIEALQGVAKKEIFEFKNYQFRFPYSVLSDVERLIGECDALVHDRHFEDTCLFNISIKKDNSAILEEAIMNMYQVTLLDNAK